MLLLSILAQSFKCDTELHLILRREYMIRPTYLIYLMDYILLEQKPWTIRTKILPLARLICLNNRVCTLKSATNIPVN